MKKKMIFFSLLLFLGAVSFYCFNGLEVVKKETAKVLNFEYIPSQSVSVEKTLAFEAKDSIYTKFRKNFRYHYQGVSMASFSDSSRYLILSDPSPWVEIDSLQKILKDFTHQIEIKTHKIGYDGFAKDILVVLSRATSENMNNLHKKISKYLFYTDYKPVVLNLNENLKRVYFSQNALDYQISLQEFNDWFLEKKEVFLEVEDSVRKMTVENIFESKTSGVFFSQLPGFVAWSLPKKSDLKNQLPNIRKFCVDSDLILGAFSDSSMLVIIGREREASIEELPPLQMESVLLLASISEKELSQSLDVNDLMAGKRSDGKDWCPTYLSKELENTEFGHLMTITDILLKDWSEKGTIKEAFYAYPEPAYYPFDKPLFRKLGINELVYNWNTANTMFAIDLKNTTIYTLNRTGALPVSYFNSQANSVSIGSRYENQASNYFASIGNTDLVRVVQYTALYQLFMDNEISYSGNTYGAFPQNKPYLLTPFVNKFLTAIKQSSDVQIDRISDTIARLNFELYQKEQVLKQVKKYEKEDNYTYTPEDLQKIFKQVHQNNYERIQHDFIEIRAMFNSLNEKDFKKLAQHMAYPRGNRSYSNETYQTMIRANRVQNFVFSIGKIHFDFFGVDLKQVQNYFVNNLSKSYAKYLKTASVIITFNDFFTTGGHNLSSKITRVNKMSGYKPARPLPKQTIDIEPNSKEKLRSPEQAVNPVYRPKITNVSKKNSAGESKPASAKTPSSPSNIRNRTDVIPAKARIQRGL